MSATNFRIDHAANLDAAIVLMTREGAIGAATLMRAMRDGLIVCGIPPAEISASQMKSFLRQTAGRPAVLLIGDDDGQDHGPKAWKQAARALSWARAVIIHAAGAEPAHYEIAVIAARIVEKVLFIECSTTTLDAWVSLVRAAPHLPAVMLVTPREGVHPIPMRRGDLN